MYHHDEGCANDTSDRRDVTDEIEIEVVVERRVDRLCRTDHEHRVAVSGRAHDGLGADDVVRARSVLHDEGLPEPLRQPLAHQTGRSTRQLTPASPTARRSGAADERLSSRVDPRVEPWRLPAASHGAREAGSK